MYKKIMIVAALMVICGTLAADDWPRFRGPSGNGVANGSKALPDAWSPNANVAWKMELPGPGASSPIVVDGKIIVTCYSGYGLNQESPGDIENLKRHVLCFDLATGKKIWQQDVKAALPEDPYSGIGVTAHGYASHTPVSDGKNVYAFLGKSGVHAFDLEGKPLWNAKVGMESDPTKWGSSSSPVVYKNIVIVTASAESQSIIGFDKTTGKEVWRQEAKMLDGMWGTPTLVKVDDDRTDLVMCVAKELWGLDPMTGELRWFAAATEAQQSYASVVSEGKRVYAVTGRGGGSVAVDAGGAGNITESNTVWTANDSASFGSPVRHGDKLVTVASGIVTVISAKDGKRIQKMRLKGAMKTGGRFGTLDYASPVVVGDRLYYLNGSGQMYVFKVGEELEQVSVNRVTHDKEVFWGSPAISDGKMILRSSKHLYCVTDKGEQVNPEDNKLAMGKEEPAGDEGRAGGGRAGGGRSGGGQRDPMAFFNRMDTDKDGMVTEKELEGNRMAERLMTLDKDGDKKISKDEYSAGIGTLFRRGRGSGGRSGYGGQGQDTRPKRPDRPKSASD